MQILHCLHGFGIQPFHVAKLIILKQCVYLNVLSLHAILGVLGDVIFYGTRVSLTVKICHSGLDILTACLQSVACLMSRLKV